MRRTILAVCSAWLLATGASTAAPPQPPAPPPAAVAARVGEYGGIDPAGPRYTVYEADDGLRALSQPPLPTADRAVAEDYFLRDANGVSGLRIEGALVPYTDLGALRVQQIRRGAHRPTAADAAARPPAEPAPRKPAELVDLMRLEREQPAGLRFDIRYAGSDNFMGFPLYEHPAAWLQRPAAEAVMRAAAALRPLGYGLMIHDAYRPWPVTKLFWDATPPDAHIFVADPAKGSRHNRGCAVDLTLYDLATGRAVEMTSRYDEMSPRAFADYPGGTRLQRWRRDLLRRAMEAEGFDVYPQEWWHFDYRGWADYAIGAASFTELEQAAAKAANAH